MNRNTIKIGFIILLFGCSVIGFMVRLPRALHHYDKQLHALYYFGAMIVISALYPKRWYIVAVCLFIFGVTIEFLQEYSNKLIGKKIHGNFDILDIKYNTIGIVIGTLCFYTIQLLIKITKTKKSCNGK